MEPGRLDATARQLAASTSRGQALKILAGSLFGTALFLKGTGRALADNPGHPITPAQPCKKDPDCPAGSTCANGVCRETCNCDDLEARIARLEQICANGCGGSGGGTPCTSAASCPQPSNACQQATCTAGVCGMTNAVAGTTCAQGVCDGNGNCVACITPANCPPAAPCTTATCVGGQCATTNLPAGTTCSSNGGTVCDGAGHCVSLCAGVVCNHPPSNVCQSSTIASVFGNGACDPATGQCFYTPMPVNCSPYLCVNGACATTCQASTDCAVGFVCSGNRCVAA